MKVVSFLSKAALASALALALQPQFASADTISALSPVFRLQADDLSGADGTYIASWIDQIGSLNLTNTAGGPVAADPSGNANKPQLYNNVLLGHKVVRFTEANTTRLGVISNSLTGPLLWYTKPSTWIAVFTRAAGDTNGSAVLSNYDQTDAFGEHASLGIGPVHGGGTGGSLAYNLEGNVTNGTAFAGGNSAVVTLTDTKAGSGTDAQLYVDGVANGAPGYSFTDPTTPPNAAQRATALSVGAQWTATFMGLGNSPFSGDLAEVVIFDRVLTSTELAAVNSSLHATYIPEPASLALLGAGGLLMLRRRAAKH